MCLFKRVQKSKLTLQSRVTLLGVLEEQPFVIILMLHATSKKLRFLSKEVSVLSDVVRYKVQIHECILCFLTMFTSHIYTCMSHTTFLQL